MCRREDFPPYDVDPRSDEYRGMCEVTTHFELVDKDEPGIAGFRPVYCTSRNTTKYIDVYGSEHWACDQRGHMTRMKSHFPDVVQKSLYEDTERQASFLPGGKIVGGTYRKGVPVYDDSDYRTSALNRQAKRDQL